jgi:predicted CopG family antitoxin
MVMDVTKQVQLSDAAYKLLKAHKRTGESFSDVVLRLGRPRKRLLEMAGAGHFGTYQDLQRFRAEDRRAERASEASRSRGRGHGRA